MSRGKAIVGKPDREKAGAPKPAKARTSKPAQLRRAAAKAPPAKKRSPQKTVASAPEPQAGPTTFTQVAAALASSTQREALAVLARRLQADLLEFRQMQSTLRQRPPK